MELVVLCVDRLALSIKLSALQFGLLLEIVVHDVVNGLELARLGWLSGRSVQVRHYRTHTFLVQKLVLNDLPGRLGTLVIEHTSLIIGHGLWLALFDELLCLLPELKRLCRIAV